MTWRDRTSLTPEEARQLHREALVIDTLYWGSLDVPSPGLRQAFEDMLRGSATRPQMSARINTMAARELWANSDARASYLELWHRAGVTAGLATTSAWEPDGEAAFEKSVRAISELHAAVFTSGGKVRIALSARDIEEAHRTEGHAIVIHWQNSTPLGHDLDRLDLFYNLGLRSVQLTYNLRNLAGDGCTERNAGGLSRFGVELVGRLNECGVVVDASHSSEAVGWDALGVSTAPISLGHCTSKVVYDHDRSKSDELLKAVADRGGYIGVVVFPAFLQGGDRATLDDFGDHLEHIARVAGIDAVGVGTDAGAMYEMSSPEVTTFERLYDPGFPWHGFTRRHRNVLRKTVGYDTVADWPNITACLARRGFTEGELRKILGLNFLRFFKEVVG